MKFVLVVEAVLLAGLVGGRPEIKDQPQGQLFRGFENQFATNRELAANLQPASGLQANLQPASGPHTGNSGVRQSAIPKGLPAVPSGGSVPGRFSYYVNSVHPVQNPQSQDASLSATKDSSPGDILVGESQATTTDVSAPAYLPSQQRPYFDRYSGYMNPYNWGQPAYSFGYQPWSPYAPQMYTNSYLARYLNPYFNYVNYGLPRAPVFGGFVQGGPSNVAAEEEPHPVAGQEEPHPVAGQEEPHPVAVQEE